MFRVLAAVEDIKLTLISMTVLPFQIMYWLLCCAAISGTWLNSEKLAIDGQGHHYHQVSTPLWLVMLSHSC